jgi:hypothetical protein
MVLHSWPPFSATKFHNQICIVSSSLFTWNGLLQTFCCRKFASMLTCLQWTKLITLHHLVCVNNLLVLLFIIMLMEVHVVCQELQGLRHQTILKIMSSISNVKFAQCICFHFSISQLAQHTRHEIRSAGFTSSHLFLSQIKPQKNRNQSEFLKTTLQLRVGRKKDWSQLRERTSGNQWGSFHSDRRTDRLTELIYIWF